MAAGFVTGPQRIPLSATMTHVLVINQSLFFTKEKKKSVFLTTCSKDPREISTAYDAIVFFSLEIPPGFETMSCFNASMFVCESGEHCVPKSMRCDFKLNCHDGTDEKDCIISLGMGINCK